MGPKTLLVSSDMITVTGHALQDRDGNVVDVNLEVGDKIRYTYPNPPADPEEEQPVRYGEIVDFISEKRVSVRWFGTDEEKAERISRIKWVPMIPAWYVKNNGGN